MICITTEEKTANWAKRTIKAGWNILMGMWEQGNKKLQEPDIVLDMEGKQVLNKSVEAEWTTGLSDLPAFEFSPYFRMKLEKLMKKSVEGKKD